MKRLIIFTGIILISILNTFSQTAEEKSLFDKINEHRELIGLRGLIWDSSVYNMSSHHAKYISTINSLPYRKLITTNKKKFDITYFFEDDEENFPIDENEDISNFEEMSFSDRYKKIISQNNFTDSISVGEGYVVCNLARTLNNKLNEPKKIEKSVTELAFASWLLSKKDNNDLNTRTISHGACSIVYFMTSVEFKTNEKSEIIQFPCAIVIFNVY